MTNSLQGLISSDGSARQITHGWPASRSPFRVTIFSLQLYSGGRLGEFPIVHQMFEYLIFLNYI